MSLPAETKSQPSLNSCQMQESIQAHKDSGLKRLLNKYSNFKCCKCYNHPARIWSLYISINIWHVYLSCHMCSPCKFYNESTGNLKLHTTQVHIEYWILMQLLPYPSHSNSLILHFLPFPGEVRENDPSQEFGTQGAIQALYQLRHHGQLYLVVMLSHDSDTPLTPWSYCRPDIPVCWIQLQGQGQCLMTKASQLLVA